MKDGTLTSEIALPYAKALMDIAKKMVLLIKWVLRSPSLLEVLDSSEELDRFLGSPLIDPEAKKGTLRQLAGGPGEAFLLRCCSCWLIATASCIWKAFWSSTKFLLRELKQTVLADVVSAVPLSEEQTATIRDRVAACPVLKM
jgi:F-type H+-transporting ATPase subunit delta